MVDAKLLFVADQVDDTERNLVNKINKIIAERFSNGTKGKIESTTVASHQEVSKLLDNYRGATPPYSAVIYIGNKIKHIQSKDKNFSSWKRLMPVVAVAPSTTRQKLAEHFLSSIDFSNVMSNTRARAVSSGKKDLEKIFGEIFYKPPHDPDITVVKLGGSAYDWIHTQDNQLVINTLISLAQGAYNLQFGSPDENSEFGQHKLILTTGAGERGNIAKRDIALAPREKSFLKSYQNQMYHSLYNNANQLSDIFELMQNRERLRNASDKKVAELMPPLNFHQVTPEYFNSKIPIMTSVAPYIMWKDQIPITDSDTQTLALANTYGKDAKVIFVKRTDGVYNFDPYRGFPIGVKSENLKSSQRTTTTYERWTEAQKGNEFIPEIRAQDILEDRIQRSGTDMFGFDDESSGHLIETSALKYFIENCPNVKEILVIHIDPKEMYNPQTGNHVISGKPDKNENLFRYKRSQNELYNAVSRKPIGLSRIVK